MISPLRLARFFFPAGSFALAAIAAVRFAPGAAVLHANADPILLGTALVGLLLTLRFGFSRHFFMMILLIGLGWGAPYIMPGGPDALPHPMRWYYCLAAVLTPLHVVLFTWWSDRGLFNSWGLTRLTWLALVPAAVFLAGNFPQVSHHPLFLDYICRELPVQGRLSAGPAAVFLISSLVILFFCCRDSAPNNEGFFWALALLAAGFSLQPEPAHFRLMAAAAMITLLLSLIETSLFFAFRDELTGLPARRALNRQLEKLGGRYVIAMIDVDHFKRFNDRYGHDVGDQVLKMVAACLKKSSGRAFRFGGEEFTIIYPGREMGRAAADAETVRKAVADARFTIRNPTRRKARATPSVKIKKGGRKVVSVTVSIGLAEHGSRHGTPRQLLKAADKALYRAKKNGRNRVEKTA